MFKIVIMTETLSVLSLYVPYPRYLPTFVLETRRDLETLSGLIIVVDQILFPYVFRAGSSMNSASVVGHAGL